MEQDIHDITEMGLAHWAASYRDAHYFAFIWGSSGNFLGCLNPWAERSAAVQVHNMWFLFYLIYCVLESDTIILESRSSNPVLTPF